MTENEELLQTKLNIFAAKLSQSFDAESQYAYQLAQAQKKIAELEEKLSVFEAQKTS